ncbi:MAG TPA: hypothetical protein VIG97_07780 [Luteimonas sp.]
MIRFPLASVLICALLTACGGGAEDDVSPAAAAGGAQVDPLPAPQLAAGSVTGMPDGPGPGEVPLGGQPLETPDLPDGVEPPGAVSPDGVAMVVPIPGMPHGDGLPPLEDEPEAGLTNAVQPQIAVGGPPPDASPAVAPGQATTTAPEPSAADAVAVVRDYYAAISSGDHGRAYALWSDGGRSSGQTPQQFAAGFAGTRTARVQPGEPGTVEGAAGSRYVEVPVSVTTTDTEGREQRYVGTYVLRRAAVDGATAGQRSWRIASAELREYQP